MRGMDAPTKIEQLNKQDGVVAVKHDYSQLPPEERRTLRELLVKAKGSTEKAASSPAKESASDDAAAS
jgi:hypothetical protein